MTNSPTHDQQLALNAQWENRDRTKDLPGSIQSADRFVRASYYLSKLPPTTDERQAVAGVLSVIRNVSTPWGGRRGAPEPRTDLLALGGRLDEQGVLRRVTESTLSPNIVWVNLNSLDLSPGSGIRAVSVEGITR